MADGRPVTGAARCQGVFFFASVSETMPEKRSGAPTMIQLGRRVMLALGLATLACLAIWLWVSWAQVKEAQLQRMRSAVILIGGQAEGYFDAIGAHLERLGDEVYRVDGLNRPEVALALLQAFKARHTDLGGASIILPDGQMLTSTQLPAGGVPPNLFSNPEWRVDLEANLRHAGLSVNRPQYGYLLKKWMIPLRYTVQDSGGKTLFLIQTSILLERQQRLWRNLMYAADPAVGLLREDGYLISRFPDQGQSKDVYRHRNLEGALYRATLKNAMSGVYQGRTADGISRYGAYTRLEHYPLYAFLSFPESTFVEMWWRNARVTLYLVGGLILASLLVYLVLARRFIRRMEVIERSLLEPQGTPDTPLPSSGVGEIDTFCEALVASKEELKATAHNRERLLIAAAQAGTYAVRLRDGMVVAANETLRNMLGRSAAELLGHSWESLLDGSYLSSGDATMIIQNQELARRVLRFRHKSGSTLWLSLAEYVGQMEGEAVRYGLAIDVSEREHLLAAVGAHSRRLQALWQLATSRTGSQPEKVRRMLDQGLASLGMDEAMINEVVGENLVTHYLAGKLKSFSVGQEYPIGDALCRLALSSRSSLLVEDLSRHDEFASHPFARDLGVRAFASVPIWVGDAIYGTLVFMKGQPRPTGFAAEDTAFMELLASWFGQTLLQKRQNEALQSQAMTDSLTGLPNRRAAELRFAEEFARAKRTGESFSVAICDLDRFKLVNDHYGHDVGDEVLRGVALVMRGELREGDWVARWGGEEFIAFLHHAETEEATAAMERLGMAVRSARLDTTQGPMAATMSIGIGLLRREDQDISRVISEADGALYEAKKQGRDRVVVSEGAKRGTLWKAGMLQHALQESRVVPAYQVIVSLQSGEVVADEALARLVRPDGSVLPAGEFIEAAEGINLVHAVDRVISNQAMARCAVNLAAGAAGREMVHFINLSPQFLARRDLVDELLEHAKQYCNSCNLRIEGVKPVVLEITERQFVGDLTTVVKDLRPLLDFGFRLALDDFGSGYSSFLYLAELPVSFLKIEGWMVRNLKSNPKVRGMVESVVLLSQRQGIKTIAECVEDGETAETLKAMGVDWAQGYHFGRPECEPQSGAVQTLLAQVSAS